LARFVASLNVAFRGAGGHGESARIAVALRALPEIATVRVERSGLAAVYSLDLIADDPRSAAVRAAAVANGMASALGVEHDMCAIEILTESDVRDLTGMASMYRVLLYGDRSGYLPFADPGHP
jgi:hypothetical protein